MEKESKEKDERLNKFKAVAVKAKKELDNSKKEVCNVAARIFIIVILILFYIF